MSINRFFPAVRAARLFGVLALALGLSACLTAPQVERPSALADDALMDQGIQYAVDDLMAQTLKAPAFQAQAKGTLDQLLATATATIKPPVRNVVVIDNTVDAASGQQTVATRILDERLLSQISARLDKHDVSAMKPDSLKSANFLVTGTLTQTIQSDARSGFKINLALTDLRSGFVVAQSAARVRLTGVDVTPTKFFRDSPAISKDRALEGKVRTAQSDAGVEADTLYLARLPVGALIAEADQQYDAGHCEDALKMYASVASRPEGQQLHVLNGLYLCETQLGHQDAAETAFGRIVALGMATNNLSVKLLFRTGSTELLADPKISASYAMWLRQISRETVASKLCLNIVGHTSKTGSEQVNMRLSLQRSAAIQRSLELTTPAIAGRLLAVGMGFRENIVGTGSDDMRDALDRRVEFKVRPC